MDEDFLWMDGSAVGTADDFLWMDGSAVQSLNILACTCTKTGRNNKMRQPNWISTVKAVYEHCMYKALKHLNSTYMYFLDQNIGN